MSSGPMGESGSKGGQAPRKRPRERGVGGQDLQLGDAGHVLHTLASSPPMV